jgi:allantoicase
MPDFTTLPDLAVDRWGGFAVAVNDEFFAPKENLLRAEAPVWREGEYTERGKWMDGWETRRRRVPGHDWCILRLGFPGLVRGVVVDTSFFTGNFPEACSIDAVAVPGSPDETALLAAAWTEILPRVTLKGDAPNPFAVASESAWTHLRLNIYPDGGVARLRVHGEVMPDWGSILRGGGWVDLAALAHGARIVGQSDMHYGNPRNMLQPGRSTHMGDGWETRRRRGPGNDWAIVRLARPGAVHRIEIDTDHYKGNAPGSCSVDACGADEGDVVDGRVRWGPLLTQTPLQPHTRHQFDAGSSPETPVTHVRLNTFPDGGIARLRIFGTVTEAPR